MKKILTITSLLLLCATLTVCIPVSSFALFGGGVEVMHKDVEVIKTGLLGQKMYITENDFKSAFAISDFEKIKITALPPSSEGTLLLGGRRVSEGQSIKRRNIGALVFVPTSAEVKKSGFSFILYGTGSENETVFTMKFCDKINKAPVAKGENEASLTLTTQEEIGIFGRLYAEDPEGDEIKFMIVGYPKRGSISLDESEGGYKYTPEDGFTGYDKFTYVARDSYGNYTTPCTGVVKVIDRMSDQVYKDMGERSEYNAAVAMSAMGIMGGTLVGDDSYFMPEESVSRAEFVSMAMKALGVRPDSSVSKTFFDDNDSIPVSLLPYVATAARIGVVDGDVQNNRLLFRPNDTITKYEAARILAALMGVKGDEDAEYFDEATVPTYARAGVSAMIRLKIFDEGEDYTERVSRADAAEYLYRTVNSI